MQVGWAAAAALVGQQNLQPLARDRGGALPPEQSEHAHAALRPNSLSNRPFLSFGIDIGTSSPLSRRAAAR